jgi:hypothetical protein
MRPPRMIRELGAALPDPVAQADHVVEPAADHRVQLRWTLGGVCVNTVLTHSVSAVVRPDRGLTINRNVRY